MHTAEQMALARLPSGIPVRTTVHTYGSGEPVVYIQAAQHGRELNGIEVLRRLHHELTDGDLSVNGTIRAVPVADPLTFDRVSYTTPEQVDAQNPNLNRCWPGDASGSIHQRMAARLWEFAEPADLIVDLHTGSPSTLMHTVYTKDDRPSRRFAEAFGTDLLLAEAAGDDASDEWKGRDFGGKLRVAASRSGIPSITPELAHNKQLVEGAIEDGIEGMIGVLQAADVLDGAPEPWKGTVARNHLGRVRAADSGLFVPAPDRSLGDRVSAGDELGTVFDPTTYERLQRATADREGIIYSIAREATVTAGSTLVGIATVLEESPASLDGQ